MKKIAYVKILDHESILRSEEIVIQTLVWDIRTIMLYPLKHHAVVPWLVVYVLCSFPNGGGFTYRVITYR